MNPKAIIESIEQNRAVMEAGFKRLGGLAPAFPREPLDGTDAASLLGQLSRAQLVGAAATLNQFAEAEAEIRQAFQTMAGRPGLAIIEGEAVVIDNLDETRA